ncbi:hypothetical protein WJX72_005595 [[Myrmecia] bisecta]
MLVAPEVPGSTGSFSLNVLGHHQDLGADQVIDYTKEDFKEVLKDAKVDMVLDMLGGKITGQSKQVLRRGGYLAHIMNAKTGILGLGCG